MRGRSHLYVPGDRPAMLDRAGATGADAFIVDLEDAVPLQRKEAARAAVRAWLDRGPVTTGVKGPEVWVRINPPSPDGWPVDGDLAVAAHPAVTGVVQAKAENRDQLGLLDEALARAEQGVGLPPGRLAVAALVETATAVLTLAEIATSPRVRRLQLGEADLAASLGLRAGPFPKELTPLRLQLVVVSAAFGLDPPVGPVWTDIGDLEGLARSCVTLRRLGYAGRAAIHPEQVPIINDAFSPSTEEVEEASALLARFENAGGGVVLDDKGRMVDEAVVRSARHILALAGKLDCTATAEERRR